jgi:hypothetical protein
VATAQSKVLLKTAVAKVSAISDRSGGQETETMILFDEGATRSFITQDLAQELGLKPQGKSTLQIATFGSSNNKTQTLDFCRIAVNTTTGLFINLTALIVPRICSPLQGVDPAVLKLPYLRGLKLAISPYWWERTFIGRS